MVYRVLLAFLAFYHRRVSHVKGRIIPQIVDKIMKIYSAFLDRLILRSSYTCRYMVYILLNDLYFSQRTYVYHHNK